MWKIVFLKHNSSLPIIGAASFLNLCSVRIYWLDKPRLQTIKYLTQVHKAIQSAWSKQIQTKTFLVKL